MSDILTNLAPGVVAFTRDQSRVIAAASPVVAGVVFESEQGPINEPVLISGSEEEFIRIFGESRPEVSNAHECILEFLRTGAPIYGLRVDNGSIYSGARVHSTSDFNKGVSQTALKSYFPNDTIVSPIAGSLTGASTLGSDVVILEIQGEVSNTISIKYLPGNGGAEVETSTEFSLDSDSTLAQFTSDLQDNLSSFDSDIVVSLIERTYGDTRYIRIVSGPSEALPALFDLQSVGVDLNISNRANLFEVYAISPGVWGNRVGFRIRDVNYGRQTTKEISLIGQLVAGDSISINIDGIEVGPVSYDTDHVTTLNALKDALAASLNNFNILFKMGEQDWGSALNPATSNPNTPSTLTIAFRHRDYGQDFELASSVTNANGDVYEPSVETLVPPSIGDGSFTLEVFLKDDPTTIEESFRVTLHENLDALNNQTNISYVINESASASSYIRISQPEYTLSNSNDNLNIARFGGSFTDDAQTQFNVHSTIQWLSSGEAGSAVTTQQFLTAIDKFEDRERYPVSLFMNAGHTDTAIQKRIIELCEKRRDCFAVLDMPSNRQEVNPAKDYTDYILGVNTSQAAIYSPDIRADSSFSPSGRFIPPSGDVCARIQERQREITNIGDPAGIQNGALPRVNSVRVSYTEEDIESLAGSNINPIIQRRNFGHVIYGAKTLQRELSALSFVGIRLDLNQIERQIVRDLDLSLFQPNDEFTRFNIRQRIQSLLDGYRRARVLSFFEIVIDERNNQSRHAANAQLNVDLILQFVYPIHRIKLQTTITSESISFEELSLAS